MSYDIRFAVKAENGQFVDFKIPEYSHITYNLAPMFRACMKWNYKQGTYYRVSEITDYISEGIKELNFNPSAYSKYAPSNGWGTLDSARRTLENLAATIREIIEYEEIPLEYVYMAW